MSEWFHVGQKVVCVNADWLCDYGCTSPLRRGAVYTVTMIARSAGRRFDGTMGEGPSLVLAEADFRAHPTSPPSRNRTTGLTHGAP